MGEIGDTFRLSVLDILSSNEHVVVLTSEEGVYRGEQISWRSAHVYSFENGRCVRFLSFQDDPFIKFWIAKRYCPHPATNDALLTRERVSYSAPN